MKEFGAIGDGITDDTIAIQNVIGNNPGKVILFPSGTYLITDILFPLTNTKWMGTENSRILFDPPTPPILTNSLILFTGSISDFSI
ncbi:MAG: glycosyl hydrolase family 28-related protein, partial [bacterium]